MDDSISEVSKLAHPLMSPCTELAASRDTVSNMAGGNSLFFCKQESESIEQRYSLMLFTIGAKDRKGLQTRPVKHYCGEDFLHWVASKSSENGGARFCAMQQQRQALMQTWPHKRGSPLVENTEKMGPPRQGITACPAPPYIQSFKSLLFRSKLYLYPLQSLKLLLRVVSVYLNPTCKLCRYSQHLVCKDSFKAEASVRKENGHGSQKTEMDEAMR